MLTMKNGRDRILSILKSAYGTTNFSTAAVGGAGDTPAPGVNVSRDGVDRDGGLRVSAPGGRYFRA